jgi:hypothetical protein
VSPSRFVALVLACFGGAGLFVQKAPAVKLNPKSTTHPAEFSSVLRVRELADGRVIVIDTTEKRIVIADFKTGKTRPTVTIERAAVFRGE